MSDGRLRGWMLIAAGLFLALMMGAILWHLGPLMLRPGVEIDGTTFTGTAVQARLFLGLMAVVGLFGALCVLNGIHILATGHVSLTGARFFLVLLLLLSGVAWLIHYDAL